MDDFDRSELLEITVFGDDEPRFIHPRTGRVFIGSDYREQTARCGYCGIYGALGRCQGCGAPNQPCAHRPVPKRCPDRVWK